jgi:hypothetical protein
MRSIRLLLLCIGLVASATSLADPGLVGAWQLVSVETIRPNGEVIHPYYGEHPQGLIIYDRSGWMSVQIVSDPMPAVPAGNSRDTFRGAPVAEKAVAADGYYAYFGPYTIDERASTVTHHVRHALYPGERGAEFVRRYTITGDLLTLVAKTHEAGEDRERHLTWRRLPASAP